MKSFISELACAAVILAAAVAVIEAAGSTLAHHPCRPVPVVVHDHRPGPEMLGSATMDMLFAAAGR
jgi:hypothetical protein